MCYPPLAEIKEGMTFPPNYLSRSGYRLPTEAEWEYACRSDTRTSRYYGNSDDLLSKYAWYLDISDNHTWPVGRLKPNDFGLFDMHGNINDWCHERYLGYSETAVIGSASHDIEDTRPVSNDAGRASRGGSFQSRSSTSRAADRNAVQPHLRFTDIGLRVARTHK